MKTIIYIVCSLSFCLGQTILYGIDTWTQSGSLGFSGGGYLIDYENNFRNIGTLINAKRKIKFSTIKYPATISSQSILANGKLKSHSLGFKISRLNYGLFEGRNIDNQNTGNYSAADINIQFGYAKATKSNRLNFGIVGGVFLSRLEESTARAITLSPGMVFNLKYFTAGIALLNYGKIIKQFGLVKEKMPSSIITSISRKFLRIPLEMELDYSYSNSDGRAYTIISGIYRFKNNLLIKAGTSSNRLDQLTNTSFLRSIFTDLGIGLAYQIDDIMIDVNSYSYGTGGLILGLGISVYY